jgi:transcriptional regulator with XRE-family HTH domain
MAADFSRRLPAVRQAAGLSRYRLAKVTGLSKQGVVNLELPGSNPTLDTLGLLARALGVSLDVLAGLAGAAEPAPKKRKGIRFHRRGAVRPGAG